MFMELFGIASLFIMVSVLGYIYFYRTHRKNISFEIKDGWVYTDLNILKSQKEMIELMTEVAQDQRHWLREDSANWYAPWDEMGDVDMIVSLWDYCHLRMSEDQNDGYDERVRLSAAAFVLGFRIPQLIWIYNRDVLVQIARYEIVRGLYWAQGGVANLDQFVPIVNLPLCIQRLRGNAQFLEEIISYQGTSGRPPPFGEVWERYGMNPDFIEFFNNEPKALKKALTVFYAVCGLYIPRDYLYFDEEVAQLVKNYLNASKKDMDSDHN